MTNIFKELDHNSKEFKQYELEYRDKEQTMEQFAKKYHISTGTVIRIFGNKKGNKCNNTIQRKRDKMEYCKKIQQQESEKKIPHLEPLNDYRYDREGFETVTLSRCS